MSENELKPCPNCGYVLIKGEKDRPENEPISNEAVEAVVRLQQAWSGLQGKIGCRHCENEYCGDCDEKQQEMADAISAITKACAERDAKLEKVKRVAAIAEKWNEDGSEMDAALSCSLNEALAHDVLEQTEKERDSLSSQLAVMKEVLESERLARAIIENRYEIPHRLGVNGWPEWVQREYEKEVKHFTDLFTNLPAESENQVNALHAIQESLRIHELIRNANAGTSNDIMAIVKPLQDFVNKVPPVAVEPSKEELLKDRERLDWLSQRFLRVDEDNCRESIHVGLLGLTFDTGRTLRSAIDAAMTLEEKDAS